MVNSHVFSTDMKDLGELPVRSHLWNVPNVFLLKTKSGTTWQVQLSGEHKDAEILVLWRPEFAAATPPANACHKSSPTAQIGICEYMIPCCLVLHACIAAERGLRVNQVTWIHGDKFVGQLRPKGTKPEAPNPP